MSRQDTALLRWIGLLALLVAPGIALWRVYPLGKNWCALGLVPSAISFLFYAWDKWQAQRGGERVPESQLLAVDALGGWPGGYLAQWLLRHKTSKPSFLFVFWLIVGVEQVALVLWLTR